LEIKDGQQLTSSCTCVSWNKYGPHCKHVVAAATVYLMRLQKAAAALNEVARETGGPSMSVSLPALAKLESWLGLSSLPDYEFLYRLTPTNSGGGRQWVVDVRRQDAQMKGPVQVKRLLAAGARIAPADERVFLELGKHESRYDSRILLTDEELSDMVELFRHRRVVYRGTALLFSTDPARPQIHLESKNDSATAELELCLPNGQAVDLKDAIVLAGRRTFAVVGQGLYAVEPDFPPRLLRKWMLEPQMAFPVGQLDRILTFFAAHLPRFRMSLRADGVEVEESIDPKFILTIEGGVEHIKARLAARYGQTTVPVSPTAQHLGYASGAGEGARKLYRRRDETEREAGKLLLSKGFKFDTALNLYEAHGDAAIELWARGLAELPQEWERYGAEEKKVRLRPRLRPR